MNQSTSAALDASIHVIRILKIASCPSLSGRSTLTFHIGCSRSVTEGEAPAIYIRVFSNSGGGYFSQEWIELSAIRQAIDEVPDGIAVTAHVLSSLFVGQSVNTRAFLLSVIKHEGLVSTVKDSKGRYARADASTFLAEVEALIISDVDLQVEKKAAKIDATKHSTPKPPPDKSSSKKPGKNGGKGRTQ